MNKLLLFSLLIVTQAAAWSGNVGPTRRLAREAQKQWVSAAAAAVLAASSLAPVADAAVDFAYPQGGTW